MVREDLKSLMYVIKNNRELSSDDTKYVSMNLVSIDGNSILKSINNLLVEYIEDLKRIDEKNSEIFKSFNGDHEQAILKNRSGFVQYTKKYADIMLVKSFLPLVDKDKQYTVSNELFDKIKQ